MRFVLDRVLLLFGIISSCLAVSCPWPCRCTWVVDSLYADCSRRSLQIYPNFDGIPVEHLDLSGNQFGEFPTQYADMDSLIYLDLSNNQISAIGSKTLIGFTSLRTLLLANNSIDSWEALSPNEAFKYAPSLKRLGLDGNRLGSFGNGESFELLTSSSLTELEISSCGITTIGGDQLVNQLPGLERLNLANNKLAQIAALPSRTLRDLDLSNCSIREVSGFFLEALQNLEALNLSRNTQLQFDTLSEDPILTYVLRKLDVSYCNLDSIELSGLPQLTEIRLRGNLLRVVDATTFANNTMLEILDISQNVLRLIGQDAFANLKRLKSLNLAFNEIARLDRNFIRNNDVLVDLNLSRNVLQKLTKIVSNSVRTINMSWCEIASIESTALSSLSVIQKLDLSNNLISDMPTFMRSETLQQLNLANCRLTTVRNNTFREFPELADLHLNGNRLTSPIPPYYFGSNKFLDQLWLGDNPWICDCHNPLFMEFYDFLTSKPAKIKDKNHLRCAAPAIFYGKLWEFACADVWIVNARSSSNGEKAWSVIMITLFGLGVLILGYTCLQKFLRKQKIRQSDRELEENDEELRRIRDLNDRILLEDATPSLQHTQEISLLPSYEDALRMPKLVRPVKSMMDLSGPERTRNSRKLRRSQTHADGEGSQSEAEDGLQLDSRQRFRSVEMLSNRDKERTAQYGPYRRTGYMEYNQSGSRRFSIEDSRFPAAHLKTQNLQSAEQIGNFQSYENSPYTKRRPKIAEIPPFKRVNMMADSVEFLTDPEYEDMGSKHGSPFAKRKPKTPILPPPPTMKVSAQVYTLQQSPVLELDPAIEDYFSAAKKQASSSTIASDFQELEEPELRSLPDDNRSSVSRSDVEQDLERGKRKKRKNSASRRVSGSFTAANAAESSSSDSEHNVLVHKPMRETLF
ncbi:insulin-like growth factor-binding protein complex acid labile subunit [Drosophila suzukii]|uniref:Insulin-like growth factor-binding protein complex acid labile subunit n=1 Tax=Drosophila suzukii TaxID=28584 RepID=A0AB39Z9E6_DROSZ